MSRIEFFNIIIRIFTFYFNFCVSFFRITGRKGKLGRIISITNFVVRILQKSGINWQLAYALWGNRKASLPIFSRTLGPPALPPRFPLSLSFFSFCVYRETAVIDCPVSGRQAGN